MTLDDLWNFWPHLLAVISVALAVPASLHCVLHKRDTRAATAWVGLIWLTPLLGTLLYILLGINRIARRARRLRGEPSATLRSPTEAACTPQRLDEMFSPFPPSSSLVGPPGR